MKNIENFMLCAVTEAISAKQAASIPIGAVIVRNGEILSSAGNEVIRRRDPTAHAEILAIRAACLAIDSFLLNECDIYVTLEPCPMCAQAISLAHIRRLYFGAYSPKYGGVDHGCKIFDHALHKTEVIGGVLETQCAEILQKFFKENKK